MSNSPQTVIHVNNQGSSALGMAGLIFSALGWLTCGLLCIPGAILSFLGLFSSKPKGLAIAGLIVGFPGTLFFIFMGAGLLAGALGLGAAATGAVAAAREAAQAQQARANAEAALNLNADAESDLSEAATPLQSPNETTQGAQGIPESVAVIPQTPVTEPTPTPVVEELPPLRRVFSDATGKFKVDATVLGYKQGWLRLRRKDGGKDLSVEVSKLSEADQTWVTENAGRLQSL